MSGLEGFNNMAAYETPEKDHKSLEGVNSALMAAAEGVSDEAREEYVRSVGTNENQKKLKYKNRLGDIFTTTLAAALDRLGFRPDEAENTATFTYGLILAESGTIAAFAGHIKDTLKHVASQLDDFLEREAHQA